MRRASIGKKRLRRLAKSMTQTELAAEFGVTKDTIRNHLKRHGLYATRKKTSREEPPYRDKDILKSAYEKTPSMLVLAEHFGVSFSTVRFWMMKHGIERNSKKVCARADPSNPWTNEETLRAAYAKRGTKRLAKMWGCSQSTVQGWLVRFGISRRLPTGGTVTYPETYKQIRKLKASRRRVLTSRETKKLKEEVGQCQCCGYDEHVQILEVHHLDRDRMNNSDDNLAVLCPNCHALDSRGIARLDTWDLAK